MEGVGHNDVLSVYRKERSDRNDKGSKIFAIVGRFQSVEKMTAAYDKASIVTRCTASFQCPLSDSTKQNLQQKVRNKRSHSNISQPQKPPSSKRTKQSSNEKQDEAEKENISPHVANIRRLEDKCRRAKIAHDAAKAKELKARNELLKVQAELSVAHNQLDSSSSRGNRNVPQDEMTDSVTTEEISSEENNDGDSDDDILYFMHGQCAGFIQFDKNSVLTFDDLRKNARGLSNKMGAYTLLRYGEMNAWVPNRAELIGKGTRTVLTKKSKAIDKLYNFFSGERCTLPQNSRNILAACDLLAYGCGDEAKFIITTGTCKAIFLAMGIDGISNEAISKALPKRDAIARDEQYLAALSRVVRRQEMRDDNVKYLGGETDHGKRGGLDHLVFPVSWIAKTTKDGEFGLKLKSHVISTNHTGGSAHATALGVNPLNSKSLSAILVEGGPYRT